MISVKPGSRARKCLIFLQCLSALCATEQAQAWESLIPGSRYVSARASALGGAFLPLGDDGASAMFYNPAAVGKIRGIQAEPMNLAITGNGGLVDHLGLNSYKAYSLSAYQPQLTASPNSFQSAAFQAVPAFYGKGFSLGMLISDDFGAMSDADGNVRYRSRFQFIPAAALGVRLAGGIVRLGYSFQWVHKAEGDISVPSGGTLGYNQGLLKGSGMSHMVGAALTLPIRFLPQLNLVGRNLGGTAFTGPMLIPYAQNSGGTPATEPMTFDASFSLQPKIDSGVYANFLVQFKDMTARTGTSILGRLCGGMEISLRDFIMLRAGWGQGYPSAGLGFKMKKGEFGVTWYSEEIGTYYHAQRDLRYMFQYQMRAF
jgi:hypothetical protein